MLERSFKESISYRKTMVMLHSRSPAEQLTARRFEKEKAEKFR